MTKINIRRRIDPQTFAVVVDVFDEKKFLTTLSAEHVQDVAAMNGGNEKAEQILITQVKTALNDPSREHEVDEFVYDLGKDRREEHIRLFGLTLNEYQTRAIKTAIYGAGHKIVYPTLGLVGEAGEVANKVKKILRDKEGVFSDEDKKIILDECLDCLWYIAALCHDLGYTLEEGAQLNLAKLASRQERNMISGSGDNR